jgi:NAD(P)H-dependent flavin oxidoreductase YrpB (nitropropane dioxygenase family)
MLRTRLSQLLGIEFPIFSAPMGPDLAGPDLVAAVSGAGGLGIMQAQLSPPADFREQIQRVRKATDKPQVARKKTTEARFTRLNTRDSSRRNYTETLRGASAAD